MNHTLSQRQTLRRHRENLDQVTREAEGNTENAVRDADTLFRWAAIGFIACLVWLVLSAQGVV
jgi:hypothetical protein